MRVKLADAFACWVCVADVIRRGVALIYRAAHTARTKVELYMSFSSSKI